MLCSVGQGPIYSDSNMKVWFIAGWWHCTRAPRYFTRNLPNRDVAGKGKHTTESRRGAIHVALATELVKNLKCECLGCNTTWTLDNVNITTYSCLIMGHWLCNAMETMFLTPPITPSFVQKNAPGIIVHGSKWRPCGLDLLVIQKHWFDNVLVHWCAIRTLTVRAVGLFCAPKRTQGLLSWQSAANWGHMNVFISNGLRYKYPYVFWTTSVSVLERGVLDRPSRPRGLKAGSS